MADMMEKEETKEEKTYREEKLKASIRDLKSDLEVKKNLFLNYCARSKLDNSRGEFFISPGNKYFNEIDSLLSELYGDICLSQEKEV